MVGFAHGDIWSFSAGTKIEPVWLQNAKLGDRKQWRLLVFRVVLPTYAACWRS